MAILVFSIVLILGSWWLGRFITGAGYNEVSDTHGQSGYCEIPETSSHPFD